MSQIREKGFTWSSTCTGVHLHTRPLSRVITMVSGCNQCVSQHITISLSHPLPLSLSSPAGVSGRTSFRTIIIISIKAHSPVPEHPCPPAPFTHLIFIYSTAVSLPLFFSPMISHFSPSLSFCNLLHLSTVWCFFGSIVLSSVTGLLWAGVLRLKRHQQKDARSHRNQGYHLPKLITVETSTLQIVQYIIETHILVLSKTPNYLRILTY